MQSGRRGVANKGCAVFPHGIDEEAGVRLDPRNATQGCVPGDPVGARHHRLRKCRHEPHVSLRQVVVQHPDPAPPCTASTCLTALEISTVARQPRQTSVYGGHAPLIFCLTPSTV